jgi:hypothetical protein
MRRLFSFLLTLWLFGSAVSAQDIPLEPIKKRGRIERAVDKVQEIADNHPKVIKVAKWTGKGLVFSLQIGAYVGNILRY